MLHLNDDLSALDYVNVDYLRELQLARLRTIVKHAYDNVQLFRSRLDALKLKPEDIKSLTDISKFPFLMSNESNI